MITNATILRIDLPGGATTGGDVTYATGAPVKIRCCQTDPTFNQRAEINQLQLEATAVVYVPLSSLKDYPILERAKIQIIGDLDPLEQAKEMIVRKEPRGVMSGGLSYSMLYLKGA